MALPIGRATLIVLILTLAVGCAAGSDGEARGRHSDPVQGVAGAGSDVLPGVEPNFGPGPIGGGGGEIPTSPGLPTLTDIEPFLRDDTALSGLAPEVIDRLRAGVAPCTVRIAYPNEGTMFPGGLLPPTIMWDLTGAPQGAAYVHVAYEGADNKVDYEFAVDGALPGELVLPADAWASITERSNTLRLLVELRIEVAGAVQACSTSWRVARGNMTGAIYYGTYTAPGAIDGGIMRLTLGLPQAELYARTDAALAVPGQGPCVGCHSMSFHGNRMALSEHVVPGFGFVSEKIYAYDVTQAPLPTKGPRVDNGAFGALTPDGTYMLTMGNPDCTYGSDTVPRSTNNMILVEGPAVARLVDVMTGAEVPAAGLRPDWYMWMPQFSPDGTKVVFNHAKPDPARPGFTDRRELAVMDYNQATHTFSNLRVVAGGLGPAPNRDYFVGGAGGGTVGPEGARNGCTQRNPNDPLGVGAIPLGACDGPCFPGWPFFTPDNRGVIFTLMSEPDFASAFPGREFPNRGELYYADTETGEVTKLENAMKVAFPEEFGFEFYPTVLPVPVGGYGWLFWTSRRSWGTRAPGIAGIFGSVQTNPLGSLLAAAGQVASAGDPSAKKIWVSAIKLRGTGGGDVAGPIGDPSFPAFYLEGQSFTGNIRAFAALNPCRADGDVCGSGVDCCAGYCTDGICGEPDVPQCSQTKERCTTQADCCPPATPDEPANECIAGFCDFIVVE